MVKDGGGFDPAVKVKYPTLRGVAGLIPEDKLKVISSTEWSSLRASPHPLLHFAFIFWSAPLATYSHSFGFLLVSIETCACCFLGTHCGGRRCALPPAPPTHFLIGSPLPTLTPSLGFILSLSFLIGSYVLLATYYATAPPPPLFLTGSPCTS